MRRAMSVSKEDLREQNRELTEVMRRLNEENDRLVSENRRLLENQKEQISTELGKKAREVGSEVERLERSASDAETSAMRVALSVVIAATWTTATAAGGVLWLDRAGVLHPRWVTIAGVSMGLLHLLVAVVALGRGQVG